MAFGFLMIGLTPSCQLVADIHTYEADPLDTGCNLPDPPDKPTSGLGKVRLANLFPSKDAIRICTRPANSTSYGRPVLRTSGRDAKTICGAGLKYPPVTIPVKVVTDGTEQPKIDVKIIPATKTC